LFRVPCPASAPGSGHQLRQHQLPQHNDGLGQDDLHSGGCGRGAQHCHCGHHVSHDQAQEAHGRRGRHHERGPCTGSAITTTTPLSLSAPPSPCCSFSCPMRTCLPLQPCWWLLVWGSGRGVGCDVAATTACMCPSNPMCHVCACMVCVVWTRLWHTGRQHHRSPRRPVPADLQPGAGKEGQVPQDARRQDRAVLVLDHPQHHRPHHRHGGVPLVH
jgi:hypothetical protein